MSKNKSKQIPKKDLSTSLPEFDPITQSHDFIAQYGKYMLLILGFLLYANTIGHDYTQDDAIVIYDNMFTQKGITGIGGILSEDTFYGFFKEEGKANLVAGGRYRPFSLIMFAIEYQFFGKNPMVGHFINALLYGLLGFVLFNLLCKIFGARQDYTNHYRWVLFAACVLFIAHPIHTEAVANIKGRDEILALLLSLSATWYTFKYMEEKKVNYAVVAFVLFLFGLLSKENTITFVAVVPMILLFFYNKSILQQMKYLAPILVASLVFLIMRTAVLGFDKGSSPDELMNNPFLKLVGNEYLPFTFGEKMATIIYTLGRYIVLLFFPHPLTHDYYPKHIDMMSFGNIKVIAALILYLAMIVAAFYYYKKDRIVSFTIFYFIATISIVSNIVFPIGTNMSERFLFMPSVGFCLLMAHVFYKLMPSGRKVLGIACLIGLLFAYKTITRNQVWQNDFTLFTTDVKTSTRSAKVLNAAGGALSTEAYKLTDTLKRNPMLRQALTYLQEAVKIHPKYKNPYLLMGNSYFYLNDYDKSIAAYESALKFDPSWKDAKNNLAVVYRDAGKIAGEKQNNVALAEKLLLKSYEQNPNDAETARLLGVAYGISGRHADAVKYFIKNTQLDPKNASAFLNVSVAYKYMGDVLNAEKYLKLAQQIDPNVGKQK